MGNIGYVLILAALPALGNFAGGLLAEIMHVSKKRLSNALHAAAGIVIAVVAVKLMPEVLSKVSGWVAGAGFGLGAIAFLGIEAVISRLTAANNNDASEPSHLGIWMIYVAVTIDLFSDGLLIGTGSTVSSALAVVLALGQLLADVPEGFATIANMKAKGIGRLRRFLLSLSFALPVLGAAVVAYYVLRGQSEFWQMGALSFVAGILTIAAVEEMLSQAHDAAEDTRGSILAFAGGFILFTFVSAGIGA